MLAAVFVTACVDGDKYHSEMDAEILLEHSKTLTNIKNQSLPKLERGHIIKIRKEANGIYYVMSEFFTDEAGYFVLTGNTLPGITGKFTKIKKNIFSYEIRG